MKKLFTYAVTIFIIIVVMTFILFLNKTKTDPLSQKLKLLDDIDKKISYFKYVNIDRYISYKEKNPSLTNIDIVTRVNLNLDYPFYTKTNPSKDLNKEYVLVNKYNYLKDDYIPTNLVSIDKKYTDSSKLLVKEANESLIKMIKDIEKDNLYIKIISAYRSYDYQKTLYEKYTLKDGKDNADTYSARPGYSEHQTGLVIDISNNEVDYNNFDKTEEYNWMINNSYKYGYILRYPKGKENITGYNYESWHYRYVGEKIAEYIHKNDITFDEYYARFLDK